MYGLGFRVWGSGFRVYWLVLVCLREDFGVRCSRRFGVSEFRV